MNQLLRLYFNRGMYSIYKPTPSDVSEFLDRRGWDAATRRTQDVEGVKKMFKALVYHYGGVPRFCSRCGDFAKWDDSWPASMKFCKKCGHNANE